MNVLLINPPGTVSFVSPPLGILGVAGSLLAKHHTVHIIDYNIEKLDYSQLFDFINAKQINVLGISIVTPKVYTSMELASEVRKKFPELLIIAGGPHATLMPEQLLEECTSVDYVIQGEGELRMPELLELIAGGKGFENMDGLAYRKDKNIINHPATKYIEDLDLLPTPARHLVDILRYSSFMKTNLSPATTMMTSRGCPYQCIYCSKPVTGTKLRALSPEKVVDEMEFLIQKYKVKEIIFYDDSFTLNKDRAMKICDLIIARGIKIKWQCETRVNLVNKELLEKMKQVGCYLIAYGIESGSERMLKILKKGVTTGQIRNAVEITQKAGIKMIGYFMMGIPGETVDDIQQTIKFSKELDTDYAQFSIATAYPGTELFQMAQSQNKIDNDWSKSIYALGVKPVVSLSDIPVGELELYVKKAYKSFYFRFSYILKKIKGIKDFHQLLYYIRGFKTLLKQLF
jgi:anaerobic magnesium-protoporphyrin IX monomethyl ester cyclase